MINAITMDSTIGSKITKAVDKIAPSWPLDQMIAVNPYWKMRDQPYSSVGAYMSAIGGVDHFLGESEYLALYKKGQITSEGLIEAAKQENVSLNEAELVNSLSKNQATDPLRKPQHWSNISDLLDAHRKPHQLSWHEALIQQISQFCAAHYQQQQPLLNQVPHKALQQGLQQEGATMGMPLYRHWLSIIRNDRGLTILMDEPTLSQQFSHLPEDEYELITYALQELAVDESVVESYLHSLLVDINGWASYVAYLRWQQDLNPNKNEQTAEQDDGVSLLAIRLAWELVLYWQAKHSHTEIFSRLTTDWQNEQAGLENKITEHKAYQKILWVWARALEWSEQAALQKKLLSALPTQTDPSPAPRLQALFCIDVRSEVIRRALEAQDDGIQTLGFAGFFGLPIAYHPQDTELHRPQLPGLLAPTITAREKVSTCHPLVKAKQQSRWQQWGQSANSGFSLVESSGWLYGFKLLKQTLMPTAENNPLNHFCTGTQWELSRAGQPLGTEETVGLCQGILSVMSISEFADTVLLVGHGSHTANNLHAAGLDCGACGGQTGEVNVRVLSQLLNDKAIRERLANRGVVIPEQTQFVAALHNTTTDVIDCFSAVNDASVLPWLQQATEQAQQERAHSINSDWQALSPTARHKKYQQRSNDWSQTRPEWGLANNNAFVIAPRSWTKGANLNGRVFLHDYLHDQHAADTNHSVLELLMTAPMIVTQWINAQYNASTTDNHRYGSGNKVLHNAVGGNLGVFEGNGGDLRIGLSKQSLHNGEEWMHTPQRLGVYIAAPQTTISQIIDKHLVLQELINNEWLFLYQWDQELGFSRYLEGEWLLQK